MYCAHVGQFGLQQVLIWLCVRTEGGGVHSVGAFAGCSQGGPWSSVELEH